MMRFIVHLYSQVVVEAPANPRSPTKTSGQSSPVEKSDEPGVLSYVQDGVKQTINYYAKNCDRPLQVGDKVCGYVLECF